MLYLLDANVLITAHNSYYSIERIPEFWEWLIHIVSQGSATIPLEIFEEIVGGTDDLSVWVKDSENKDVLVFAEEVNAALVARTIDEGYANDLSDDEVEKLGRDPFLIAYALAAPDERCIVTTEVSKPSRKRADRQVPDVCSTMGVKCIDSFTFFRILDFSTSWNS